MCALHLRMGRPGQPLEADQFGRQRVGDLPVGLHGTHRIELPTDHQHRASPDARGGDALAEWEGDVADQVVGADGVGFREIDLAARQAASGPSQCLG